MEYNKNRFQKVNDKKVLHKVKKHWVVLSLSMLALLGGEVAVTRTNAHAADDSQSHPQNDQMSTVKDQINQNLVQAHKQTRQTNGFNGLSSSSQRASQDSDSAQNTNSAISQGIVERAHTLHNRILHDAVWNNLQQANDASASSSDNTGSANGRSNQSNLNSEDPQKAVNNNPNHKSVKNIANNGANNKPKANPMTESTEATTKRRPNLKALHESVGMNRPRRLLGATPTNESNTWVPGIPTMEQGDRKYVWSDGRWGTAHAIANGNTHTIYVYGKDNNSDTVGQTYVAYNYYQGPKDNDYGNSKFALAPNPSIFGNLFFQKEDKYGHITNNLPKSPDNHDKNDWSIQVYNVKAPVDASELFSGVGAQYFPHGSDIQTAVKSINVQGLHTSDTTDMSDMFDDVNGNSFDGYINDNVLTSISGLSDLDTSKVTNFRNMFQNNAKLKSLDLGAFDTLNANKTGKTNVIPENVNQLTLGPKTMLASDSIANVKGPWGSTSTDANTYGNVNHQFWLNNTSGITKLTDGQSHPGTWNWNNIYWTDGRWGNAHVTVNGRTDKIIVSDGKGPNGSDVGETKDLSGSYLANGNSNFFANVYFPSENSNGHITKLPNDKKDWQIIIKSGKAPKDSSYLFSGPKTYYYTNSITPQIKSIDVGGLDTSGVTDMHDMFNGINANSGDGRTNDSALTSITGLDHLDTSKVSDFTNVFQNDPGLTSLDLSDWDTTHATKKANMIPENVTKLTLGNHTILADNSIANVKNGWDSASDDTGTNNNGDHQYWKQNSNDPHYTKLSNGQSHPGTWTWKDAHAYWNDGRWGNAHVIIDGYSDKIIVSDNKDQQNGSDVGVTMNNSDKPLSKGNPNFFANVFFPDEDSNGHITSLPNKTRDWQIIVKEGVNAPSDASYLFSGPKTYWFTNGAYITPQIKSIDVSGLNTANVTNMESMFNDVNAEASDNSDNTGTLTSITGLSDWDTSKVTDFVDMFQNNPNLTSLNLSNWDTTNAPTSDKTNYSHVNWNSLYNADNRINMIPTNVTKLTLGPKTELAWDSIADVIAKRTPAYKNGTRKYEYDLKTGKSDIPEDSSFWNSGYLNDSSANPEEQPNNGNHWWWHDNRGNYANLTQETSNPGTWTWDKSTPSNTLIWGDATVNIDPNTDTIYIDKGSTGGMYNSSDNKTPESKWSDHDNIFDNIRHVSDPSKVYSTLPNDNNDWKIVMNGTRIIQDHSSASDLFNSDGSPMAERIQSIDLGNGNGNSVIRLDPNVNGFNRTFNGMKNVNQINLSGLNMTNVGYLSYFMSSDPSLVNVNLRGLNLINTQYVHHLFANDTSLESANLGNLKNQPSLGYSSNDIFTNDNKLKRLAISRGAIFRSSNSGNPQAWGVFFNPNSTNNVVNAKGNPVDIKSLIGNGSEGTGSDSNNPSDGEGDYEYYLVSNLPVYWAPNLPSDTTIPSNLSTDQYGQYYDRTGMKYPASAYKDTEDVKTSPIVVLKTPNQPSTGGSTSDDFKGYQGNQYNSNDINLENIVVTPTGKVNTSTAKAPAGYAIAGQTYSDESNDGDYYVYANLNGLPVTGNVDYYTSDGEGDNHIIAQDAIKSDQPAYVGRKRSLRDINQIPYKNSSYTIKGYHVVHDGQSIDSDSNNLNQTIHSELSPGQNMLDNLGQWIKPFHVKIAGNYETVPVEFINGNKQQNEKFATQGNVNFMAYVTIPTNTNPTITELRHNMASVLKSMSDYKRNQSFTHSDETYWKNLNNSIQSNSKVSSNVKSELQNVINSIKTNQPFSSDTYDVFKDIGYGEAKRYQANIYNDISNSSDYDKISPQSASGPFPAAPNSSDDLTTGSIYSLNYSDVNNWVQNNDPTYTLANQPILSTLSDTSRSMNPNGYDTINDLMKDSKYMGKIDAKTGNVNPIIYVVKSAKEIVTYNYRDKKSHNLVSKSQDVSAVGNYAPIPSDTTEANANGLIYGYNLLTDPDDYSYGSTPVTMGGKRYIKISLHQAHANKDPNVINMYVTPKQEQVPVNYVYTTTNQGKSTSSLVGVHYINSDENGQQLYAGVNSENEYQEVKVNSDEFKNNWMPSGYKINQPISPITYADLVNGSAPGNINDNSGQTVPFVVQVKPNPNLQAHTLTIHYINQNNQNLGSDRHQISPKGSLHIPDDNLPIYRSLIDGGYTVDKDRIQSVQSDDVPYGQTSAYIYMTGQWKTPQAPVTVRYLDANGNEVKSDQTSHVTLDGHVGDVNANFNTSSDFKNSVPAGYVLYNPNETYNASINNSSAGYQWNSDYAGTRNPNTWDFTYNRPLIIYRNHNACNGSIMLHYVNQNGQQVGPTAVINKPVNTRVNVTNSDDGGQPVPAGYQLLTNPYNQDVNYTVNGRAQQIFLRIIGNKRTSQPFTVKTIATDINGKQHVKVYSDETVSGQIGSSVTIDPSRYLPGSDYDYNQTDFEHTVYMNADGSVTPNQITLEYNEDSARAPVGNVTVHYLNQHGQQVGSTALIDSKANSFQNGQQINVSDSRVIGNEPVPSGYQLGNSTSDQTIVNSTPQTMNIQVHGQPDPDTLVVHRQIKQLDGTVQPLSDVNLSLGRYGDVESVDPYDYIPAENNGMQYTVDSADHLQNIALTPNVPLHLIKFTYDQVTMPNITQITVHYIDDTTGHQIDQESDSGPVGSRFDITPYLTDIPEGYYYDDHNKNVVNTFQHQKNWDIQIYVKPNQNYPSDVASQNQHPWNGLTN